MTSEAAAHRAREAAPSGNPLAHDLDRVLDVTRELWRDLDGARFFLTGGTGFFGHWMLETMAWAADRLDARLSAEVLTRDPRRFRRRSPHLAEHPAIRLRAGDIRTFRFPEGAFSHILHLAVGDAAARGHAGALGLESTMLGGTLRVLEFARSRGAGDVLLASTGAVYGPAPADLARIPETYAAAVDPLDPAARYTHVRRTVESLCVAASVGGGPRAKIARGFAFVGPYLPLDGQFAIGNFIGDALAGKPITVKGDGTPFRSYLYAGDLAAWLWTVLVRGRDGVAYNVGSELCITIGELARLVASIVDPPVEVRVLGLPTPGAAPSRYVPDTALARTELGVRETVPLEEAVRRAADWARTSLWSAPLRRRGRSAS